MSFIWPPMLLTLLLIPVGWWIYRTTGRRRARALARAYGSAALGRGVVGTAASGRGTAPAPSTGSGRGTGSGQRASGQRGGVRRVLPNLLVVAGFAVMAVALARPQAVVALPKQQGIVVLAFDVSGSMAAKDISPTRIAAAQSAAKDFVAKQPSGISIGVVAFSDSGVSVQVPTTDPGPVDTAIQRLTPKKGTSLGAGITASLDAIAAAERGPYANDYYTLGTPAPTASPTPVPAGYHAPAAIVLLTDGENNERPDPAQAAQAAADRGVRIYTIGIGSAGGTDLDVNGIHIHTTLDAAQLQQIASVTGGSYYAATDAAQLHAVYDNLDTQLVATPELTELTSLFAGLSALLLLSGALGSLFFVGRLP